MSAAQSHATLDTILTKDRFSVQMVVLMVIPWAVLITILRTRNFFKMSVCIDTPGFWAYSRCVRGRIARLYLSGCYMCPHTTVPSYC